MSFLSLPFILTHHTFLLPNWRNVKCPVLNWFTYYGLETHWTVFSFLPTRVSKTMFIARGESILQTWLWTTNSKLEFFQKKPSGCFEITAEWAVRSSPSWAQLRLRHAGSAQGSEPRRWRKGDVRQDEKVDQGSWGCVTCPAALQRRGRGGKSQCTAQWPLRVNFLSKC